MRRREPQAELPEVFVGSSNENVDLADAIHANLDECASVTVWKRGAFRLSETTIDGLVRNVSSADFGIFLLAPDDVIKVRGQQFRTVRDNVLFEVGLFIGAVGRQRTFLAVPDTVSDLRLPNDIAGVTVGKYEWARRNKNPRAATGAFCADVRLHIRRLRRLKRSTPASDKPRRVARDRPQQLEPVDLASDLAAVFSRVAQRCRQTMNPEPLDWFRAVNSWLTFELHRYFECRLWPEALDRAQRDISGVSIRDPKLAIIHDAKTKAKLVASRYGLGYYWDEWAVEHLT